MRKRTPLGVRISTIAAEIRASRKRKTGSPYPDPRDAAGCVDAHHARQRSQRKRVIAAKRIAAAERDERIKQRRAKRAAERKRIAAKLVRPVFEEGAS